MVIVVGFDKIEDLDASIRFTGEGTSLKHFVFEGAHERFGPGVVVGVGTG